MKPYLISYDLVTPGRDYAQLGRALDALKAQPVLLSQRIVRATARPRSCAITSCSSSTRTTRLLVNVLTDWAAYNLMLDLSMAAA